MGPVSLTLSKAPWCTGELDLGEGCLPHRGPTLWRLGVDAISGMPWESGFCRGIHDFYRRIHGFYSESLGIIFFYGRTIQLSDLVKYYN